MEANALQPDSQPVTTTELAQAQQGQFSRRRALGLMVGAVLILGLMAIFGWKLFEGAQTQVDSGVAPDGVSWWGSTCGTSTTFALP